MKLVDKKITESSLIKVKNKPKKILYILGWLFFGYVTGVMLPIIPIAIMIGESHSLETMQHNLVSAASIIGLEFALTPIFLYLALKKKFFLKHKKFDTNFYLGSFTINLYMILMIWVWFFIIQATENHKVVMLPTKIMITLYFVYPLMCFWTFLPTMILMNYLKDSRKKMFKIILIASIITFSLFISAMIYLVIFVYISHKDLNNSAYNTIWWILSIFPIINYICIDAGWITTGYAILALIVNCVFITFLMTAFITKNKKIFVVLKSSAENSIKEKMQN